MLRPNPTLNNVPRTKNESNPGFSGKQYATDDPEHDTLGEDCTWQIHKQLQWEHLGSANARVGARERRSTSGMGSY